MYAVKISFNEETPIVAGAEDMAGLHVIMSCNGVPGFRAAVAGMQGGAGWLSVAGLACALPGPYRWQVNWITQRDLRPGDVVTVELLEAAQATPSSDSVPVLDAMDERAQFEQARDFYLARKKQYDT